MKINGYSIREVLKNKMLELATLNTTFEETLYKFEDEEKGNPKEVMDKIMLLETQIAKLGALQSQYNLVIKVNIIQGDEMTLETAIKLVGGAGRASKQWRGAAKGKKLERYERDAAKTRDKDKDYAKATISKTEALNQAKSAEKFASQLRNAIARGNMTDIEFDDSVAALFE